MEEFTYLGSKIDRLGGTDADVKARIGKARMAFTSLKNVWKSRHISTKTKLRFFNSNVKSVLLYGSDTWRSTKKIMSKVQTFINGCLRKNIKNLLARDHQQQRPLAEDGTATVEEEIKKRKWR